MVTNDHVPCGGDYLRKRRVASCLCTEKRIRKWRREEESWKCTKRRVYTQRRGFPSAPARLLLPLLLLIFDSLVGLDLGKVTVMESCTGRLRVCHDGEDPWHGQPNLGVQHCSVNKLERNTVILTGGAWRTGVYGMWIAQILLEEQLQVPVKLDAVDGGSYGYYEFDDMVLDKLDGRIYSWDALHLASNGSMDCSDGFRELYSSRPADLDGCTKNCVPCAHAMLEVWPNGQEENYNEYVLEKKTVEDGGSLGTVGEFGWWATRSILDDAPLLSSYRGMNHQHGAEQNNSTDVGVFRRPITFGEYCNKTYDEWAWVASALGGPNFNLDASIESHFCHHFFQYAMVTQHGITYPAGVNPSGPEANPAHVEYYAKRRAIVDACAANRGVVQGFLFYDTCPRFWVTPEELLDQLPMAVQELYRAGYPPGIRFLYNGMFQEDERDDGNGILQTTSGCGLDDFNRTMDPSPGAHASDVWEESGFGDPGYGRFQNYDSDIVSSHGLDVKPLSMQSDTRAVLELSARLSVEHPERAAPVLISWSRPSSLFLRHNYTLDYEPWGNYSGEHFRLGKVQLPEYHEGCSSSRRKYQDRCAAQAPPYVDKEGEQCGYEQQILYKAFASKLKEYAPEAYQFLRRFTLTRDQQEYMLAEIDYGRRPDDITIPTRTRQVICEWVRDNKDIWENWLPPTAHEIQCLGERGKCSGHGTCVSTPELLALHPNAGMCECDRGYVGDDCSGFADPELLNVVYTDVLFLAILGLQLVTMAYALYLLRVLGRAQNTSTVFRTTHPLFLRIILWSVVVGSLGPAAWAGQATTYHCALRPLLMAVPLGVVNSALYVKLHRKRMRAAVNTEDIIDGMRPVTYFYLALFPIWFLVFTPLTDDIRLETRPWEYYSSCLYGNNLAAFEALLLISAGYLGWTNFRLAWELRFKPTYFNEGRDMLKTSALLMVIAPASYFSAQVVGSPDEKHKFLLISLSSLGCVWVVLFVAARPKFVVHFYEPARNNIKDGLHHPTGDPALAVGDPVLDMGRTLREQDQHLLKNAYKSSASMAMRAITVVAGRARQTNVGARLSYVAQGVGGAALIAKDAAARAMPEPIRERARIIATSPAAQQISVVSYKARDGIQRARNSIAVQKVAVVLASSKNEAGRRMTNALQIPSDLTSRAQNSPTVSHKVHAEGIDRSGGGAGRSAGPTPLNVVHPVDEDGFKSPQVEVTLDPADLHHYTKRSLVYRSPEMYQLLERKLRILERENTELTKIMEEHRIDPVTGEMDLDFMDALFLVEREHRERFRDMEDHYLHEIGQLEKDREDEREELLAAKQESEIRLNEEKEAALLELKVKAAAQANKMLELEKDQRALSMTLRGTLPTLGRLLAIHNYEQYEEALEQRGIDSTEKLLLASEQDLKLAGIKIGHIRKLLRLIHSMKSSTPKVLMPDGAIKAMEPTLTVVRPGSERGNRPDSSKNSARPGSGDNDMNDDDPGSNSTKFMSMKDQKQRKKKKKKQSKRAKSVAWIRNKDQTTGKKYLVNPLTGETKWDEGDLMSSSTAQDELLFSDDSDILQDLDDTSAGPQTSSLGYLSGKFRSIKKRKQLNKQKSNNSEED